LKRQSDGILVFSEFISGSLHPVTLEILGKARDLADKVSSDVLAVMVGSGLSEAARELVFHGADVVYSIDHPSLTDFDPLLFQQNLVPLLRELNPLTFLLGATQIGRCLGPRIAAQLGTGITADCTDLDMTPEGNLVQVRPAFAGNIIATIITRTRPQMATVRYRVMKPASRDQSREGRIIARDAAFTTPSAKVITSSRSTGIDISSADIIVSVGRGLPRREDLRLIEDLADALGGIVGSSRPLVDDGWISKEHQVGFSGNVVKPRLYIACGISGSPQHLFGMKDSEYIIAINKDPSAAIFRVADVGVTMDLNEVLPLLALEIRKRNLSH